MTDFQKIRAQWSAAFEQVLLGVVLGISREQEGARAEDQPHHERVVVGATVGTKAGAGRQHLQLDTEAAAGSALFPLISEPPLLMAVAFVIGLGLGSGQPLSMTLSFERSPPGRSGEVAGLRTIASNSARLLVPLVSGAFGAALGAGAVFWMNAVNLSAVSYMARRTD